MTKNSGEMTCRDPSSQTSCLERWKELLLARLHVCAGQQDSACASQFP